MVSKSYSRLQRVMDVALAGPGLVLATPLMVLIAMAIRAVMREPALFKQRRIGISNAPFVLLKFRTMRTATDSNGRALPDCERLTWLGRLLRKTSFDELPQLWNVLRGEMSLVGPRPLLPVYLPRYTAFQRRRHEVKPGITGWVQVNGRNALTWEQKFELDVWYVDHKSFLLDLKILLLTVLSLLQRSGIQHGEHATMPEFLGSIERTAKP